MKSAIVSKGPKVKIIDEPIPTPGPYQVVTKVVVSGSNPKDWKYPDWVDVSINQGDDIAGVVHTIGENVTEFKPGDRVAAFHQMGSSGGSFAEYAVSWAHTTFHIPKKTSFEEAATLPLALMTAAVGLYQSLSLPLPWLPATNPTPLIIYGAASAVGSFTIQLAQRSNIHPLICVAGRGIPHVESLISKDKGDVILDYREGDEKLVQGLQSAAKAAGKPILHTFDAVSEKNSTINISKILDPNGRITMVLPPNDDVVIPSTMERAFTSVGSVHARSADSDPWSKAGNEDFGFVMFRLFGRGLQEGWLKGHPYEVVPGGLAGVERALKNLKEGKASAVKYVFRVGETEGLGKD